MLLFVWKLIIGVVWILGLGVVFYTVHYVVTAPRRREIEVAADLEYEEMQQARRRSGYENDANTMRRYRLLSESERRQLERLSTETGKKLIEMERMGKCMFLVGSLVALVTLIVYFRMNG